MYSAPQVDISSRKIQANLIDWWVLWLRHFHLKLIVLEYNLLVSVSSLLEVMLLKLLAHILQKFNGIVSFVQCHYMLSYKSNILRELFMPLLTTRQYLHLKLGFNNFNCSSPFLCCIKFRIGSNYHFSANILEYRVCDNLNHKYHLNSHHTSTIPSVSRQLTLRVPKFSFTTSCL